ncbi:PREDICTED: F-box only protein 9-like [Priapulus caudatus]|uniref:F-box only protein 9-like n=1 Tax=Priapulus caudatus TaxID=37621 RepID=A0ABM1DSC7_PRICU|nr:PREDICTED: F-box only protein 9-like [Priapulus caudatus]
MAANPVTQDNYFPIPVADVADAGDGAAAAGNGGEGAQEGIDEESEDEEAESSPAATVSNSLDTRLEQFRLQWQQELTAGGGRRRRKSSTRQEPNEAEQAEELFQQGVDAEKCGNLYEAIGFYRRAIQLVPDIEFRIQESSQNRGNQISETDYESEEDSDTMTESGESDSEDEEAGDNDAEQDPSKALVAKFNMLKLEQGDVSKTCHPESEQKCVHISALPVEVLVYIFKWVVSSELDMRSLEQLAGVSRGFYVCARDREIWRLACEKVFGVTCGSPTTYGSWRNMYILRPHVRYNGCYISKTTYVRHGEQSLDNFYRPWHTVNYYRYLRFWPDGTAMMLTTPDDPPATLPKLRTPRDGKTTALMVGHYRMVANAITVVVKKHKERESNYYSRYRKRHQQQLQAESERTFHMEFQLKNIGMRTHCQLAWQYYSIHTLNKNSQDSISEFELNGKSYPPFHFSRVKSYTSSSQNPLQ